MKKLLLISFAVLTWTSMHSQGVNTVLEDWNRTTGSQHFFYKNVTKTVGSYVYVAGATMNAHGDYDILLAKYNNSGIQQWIVQVDGAAHYQDFATALQLDASGNIYITGAITNDTTTMMSDLFLSKYNSSGSLQWSHTYDGYSLYDCGTDIFATTTSVAVVGSSYNASVNLDFITILYNSSGTQLWATRYAHTSGMDDVPVSVSKKGSSVVVAGAVQTGTGAYSWAAVSYTASTGVQNALTVSSGGTTGIEEAHAMVQDANGYVYIAGITPTLSNGYDYDVIKLDSNLVIQWEHTYDGADHLNDIANGIQVNSNGEVYVTGYTNTATHGSDYLTLKYNSTGSFKWARTFNDSLNGDDEASALALDNSGKPVITGQAHTVMNQMDYFTMKYDTAGTMQWGIYFDGSKHLDDRATNIAIDTVGAIVVTGASETATGIYQYATVRYVEKNIITPTDYSGELLTSSYLFYSNKGQVLGSNDTIVPSVIFYTEGTYPDYYFKTNGFSFAYTKIDSVNSTYDTLNRVDVSFNNSNASAKTYSLDEDQSFRNYYTLRYPQGITQIHGNKHIVTVALYSNIDLEYSSNTDGLKYYFIIKPGGAANNIKPEFTGASSYNLNGTTNVLTVISSLGSVAFARPIVYQLNSSNVIVPITGWTADWQTNGASNKYKFNLGSYDTTKTLIIEVKTVVPSVATAPNPPEWGTFFGGTKDDFANDITSDNRGNIYVTGYTSSPHSGASPFPITSGTTAFQSTLKGNRDAFIGKFNGNYTPKWITYYGGNGADEGNGITHTTTNGGQIFICGTTTTNDTLTMPGFSGGTGSYVNNTAYGGDQCFFARFSDTTGYRNWHTYYAGYNSVATKVKCDKYGNVYFIGHTGNSGSVNSCTTTNGNVNICNPGSGAYSQIWYGGGTLLYDCFIAKFNSNTALAWSSYFGGNSDDEAYDLAIDGVNEKLYVVGTSSSTGNASCSPTYGKFTICNNTGFSQSLINYSGSNSVTDGFLLRFDFNGVLDWSTFIGGFYEDGATGVAVNSNGDVYVTGYTAGTFYGANCAIPTNQGFPYCNNGYTQSYTGSYDAFVTKFDYNRNLLWSTFLGGGSAEGLESNVGGPKLSINQYDDIYVYGTTRSGSSSGSLFPVQNSSTYYNDSLHTDAGMGGLNTDCFVAAFDKYNNKFWSTYFGGKGYEASTTPRFGDFSGSIVTPKNHRVYVCGGTYSTSSFPLSCPGTPSPYCQGYGTVSSLRTDAFIANLRVGNYTGISQHENEGADLMVFPNPSNGFYNVVFTSNESSKITIEAFNLLGERVSLLKVNAVQGKNQYLINLSNQANGIYFINIYTGTKKLTAKIIKN